MKSESPVIHRIRRIFEKLELRRSCDGVLPTVKAALRQAREPHWRRCSDAMPSAVKLREDYSAEELRALARRSKDVNQSRRLLSLAAVRDAMDRGSAAKIGGMNRQTLRDRVRRFNASGPEGLIGNWTEGPKPRLAAEQLCEFATIVEAGRIVRRTGSCVGGASTSSASSRRGSASSSASATSESFKQQQMRRHPVRHILSDRL